MSKHLVFKNAVCLRESKAAILVDLNNGREPMWIPQSQIHDDSDVYESNGSGKLIVTRWIAEQKGIEDWGEDYDE